MHEDEKKGWICNVIFYSDVRDDGWRESDVHSLEWENNEYHETHSLAAQFHPEFALWCQ